MKFLMRAAMPFDYVPSVSDILVNEYLGMNIGNLLFHNSVSRWLMSEDVEITRIKTRHYFTDKEIEYFNAEYDMLILPLANALRTSFIEELKIITDLVNRLDIPCVVIGLGMQRNLDATAWNYPYDEPTKEFFKAVLNKSAIVGIRGEMTAHYLQNIGLTPEKDFTIIGCPSLYTYGYNLPKPEVKELTTDSPVSFNANVNKELYPFLESQARQFNNFDYVCTLLYELRSLYAGYPYPKKEKETNVPEKFPIHFTSDFVKDNRVVGFVDQYSWLNFLRTKEFSFGGRIHGTIANLLAGTPAYVFVNDGRIAELVDFHNIPHMELGEINEDTNIFDIHEKTDFTQILRGHKERVDNYVSFLDKNHVPHLPIESMGGETPFDFRYSKLHEKGEIRHFIHQDYTEQERRLEEYYLEMWNQRRSVEKECDKQNKIIEKRERQNEKLTRELTTIKNTKAYKCTSQQKLDTNFKIFDILD